MNLPHQKNKKAKEIAKNSEEMLNKSRADVNSVKRNLDDEVKRYTKIMRGVMNDSMNRFDDQYMNVQKAHFNGSVIAYTDYTPENIAKTFDNAIEKIEPLYVKKVGGGGLSSYLTGLFGGVLVSAVGVGIYSVSKNIDPEKLIEPGVLQSVFKLIGADIQPFYTQYIGETAMTVESMGMSAVGIVAGLLALVFGYMAHDKKATKNLHEFEEVQKQAEAQCEEYDALQQKENKFAEYVHNLANTAETMQIFLDEYVARMRRIVHVEGNDYNQYSEASKEDVKHTVDIYRQLRGLMKSRIVAPDATVLHEAAEELERTSTLVSKMTRVVKNEQPSGEEFVAVPVKPKDEPHAAAALTGGAAAMAAAAVTSDELSEAEKEDVTLEAETIVEEESPIIAENSAEPEQQIEEPLQQEEPEEMVMAETTEAEEALLEVSETVEAPEVLEETPVIDEEVASTDTVLEETELSEESSVELVEEDKDVISVGFTEEAVVPSDDIFEETVKSSTEDDADIAEGIDDESSSTALDQDNTPEDADKPQA